MPRLMLYVHAQRPVSLPLASQRAVQGMLYGLLACDARLAARTHDEGRSFESHAFKFFTFSRLRARARSSGRNAVYEGGGRIEIRTPDARLAEAFEQSLRGRERIELLHQPLQITDLRVSDGSIEQDCVLVRMVTPLTVHMQGEGGFIRFYAPDETEFARLVQANYRRKASAFRGEEVADSVRIAPVQVLPRDKCVTAFKGTSICGYYGFYRLSGAPEALTFLYYAGLGARNSQGFGMFDVAEESAPLRRIQGDGRPRPERNRME